MKECDLKFDAYESAYGRENTCPKNCRYTNLAFCTHLQIPDHKDRYDQHSNIREGIEHGRCYIQRRDIEAFSRNFRIPDLASRAASEDVDEECCGIEETIGEHQKLRKP